MDINLKLHLVFMTLAVTAGAIGAIVLAVYFMLRGRLVLAAVCLLCLFALLRPGVVYGAELCRPVSYADGDTFSFRQAGDLVRVRVAGFDAPERGQPFSEAAERKLRELTEGGALCDCYKQDRHGRSVCTVRTRAGQSVAVAMLGAGLGCIDPRFEGEASPPDRQAARDALQRAQVERLGMWSQVNPQCAFDYRRHRSSQALDTIMFAAPGPAVSSWAASLSVSIEGSRLH